MSHMAVMKHDVMLHGNDVLANRWSPTIDIDS